MRRRTAPLAALFLLGIPALLAQRDTEPRQPSRARPASTASAGEAAGAPTARFQRSEATARHSGKADGASILAEHVPPPPADPWVPGQVIVRPAEGVSLADLARRYDASVLRPAGPSGFGVLAVDGAGAGLLADLQADPDVDTASRQGRIVGAAVAMGTMDAAAEDISAYQWHLDAADVPAPSFRRRWDPVAVVAVVDTGVAYENWSDASGLYLRAPSLAYSSIVAPHDFVNGDDHANDDHMHGTHVASLIAGSGDVLGVDPGAALMPLKVLDANNQGYESDLVDAIYWAVDHGADVINMSLAFPDGYAPSRALVEAIGYARDHDVVMVAAAGNHGLSGVAWPARHPDVIAVGASCLANAVEAADPAPYGNRSPAVSIMAPGGCLDRDADGDGRPDGILAETFSPGDPTDLGYWYMAGTSQATALVSGAVAKELEAGADPGVAVRHLQKSAQAIFGADPFADAYGAGGLDVAAAVSEAQAYTGPATLAAYHVAMLPWIEHDPDDDDDIRPAARFTVIDEQGAPVAGVVVLGGFRGSTDRWFACTTDANGACDAHGDHVPEDGSPAAWAVSVAGILDAGVVHPAYPAFFLTDGLDATIDWMLSDPDLANTILAIWWPEGDASGLADMAEGYAVTNGGAGLATSPFGVVFNPEAIGDSATVTEVTVDGSGLATSPFGITLVTFDGSGLATSPFGITLTAFDGSGLATSPFGITDTFTLTSASTCTDCTFAQDPVFLESGSILADSLAVSASATQALLDQGGWVDPDGNPGASLIVSAGALDVPAAQLATPAGDGAEPFVP